MVTRRYLFASFVVLLALPFVPSRADSPPSDAQVQALIASMRETALAYDSRLPDFICTQVTKREVTMEDSKANATASEKSAGTREPRNFNTSADAGGWSPIDSYEQEVTYFGHKESYHLLRMNGKKAESGKEAPEGVGSAGEFGTTLKGIFDPASKTQFAWKKSDKLRGHPAQVFTFAVAKENSSSQLEAGKMRAVVAYKGLVYFDPGSKAFLRITTEAETPGDFPLQHVTHVLDYGRITIAGEQYLIPLKDEMEMHARRDYVERGLIEDRSSVFPFRNTIDFRAYKKYGVDTVLKIE